MIFSNLVVPNLLNTNHRMHNLYTKSVKILEICKDLAKDLVNGHGNIIRRGPIPRFSDLEVVALSLAAETDNINRIYECIKEVCRTNDGQCHRSDDQYTPNSILKYTMELILKSQVIIAVLDGRNANVYYEVGIAHSIGKTVILVNNVSRF